MSQHKTLTLEGGPADGRRVEYLTPLPTVLVVATRNGRVAWHDYRRIGPDSYRYVPPAR